MPFFVSPGVFIREKDISDIVANLITSSAALIGSSNKGDIDAPVLVTNSQQFIQEFGEPVPGMNFHYSALAYLENGDKLFAHRVHNGALYGGVHIMQLGSGPNIPFTVGSATKTFQSISGTNLLFTIFAKDPGVWNNNLAIRITNIDTPNFEFSIEVYEKNVDGVFLKVETWDVSRKTKIDGFGRQLNLEEKINGFSRFIAVADSPLADTVMPEVQATNLIMAAGNNGSAVTSSQLTLGWDKVANPDDFDIRMLINGGYTDVAVQQKMKDIAESRKDAVAILDMPFDQLTSVTSMINWRNVTQNFNSSYSALYAPWVKVFDPFNDIIVSVPPSGYIASMYAFNDFVAEPWFAAAGFNRGQLNVLGLTNVFTLGERDLLYVDGINPLQTFRGEGNVIWGQKTQQTKASALDRLNVRRSLIVIEKSIAISLRSFVFEPNNTLTRFRVRVLVEEFLGKLGARGAFQTELGDKGFRVLVDTTNNTPATIDNNELHVDIFLKPVRVAEFIQLSVIVTATGISFEELISRGVQF